MCDASNETESQTDFLCERSRISDFMETVMVELPHSDKRTARGEQREKEGERIDQRSRWE